MFESNTEEMVEYLKWSDFWCSNPLLFVDMLWKNCRQMLVDLKASYFHFYLNAFSEKHFNEVYNRIIGWNYSNLLRIMENFSNLYRIATIYKSSNDCQSISEKIF